MVFKPNNETGRLDLKDANTLISLHNHACEDWVYGEKLLYHLHFIAECGNLQPPMVEQLYLLSVDWPFDIMIDHLTESDGTVWKDFE